MIEINIKCDSLDEARVYLNGPQYLNLLEDFCGAIRNAQKHGSDQDILRQVESFYPELCRAVDHNTGPY